MYSLLKVGSFQPAMLLECKWYCQCCAPPKTNILNPKNEGFGRWLSFSNGWFSDSMLVFKGSKWLNSKTEPWCLTILQWYHWLHQCHFLPQDDVERFSVFFLWKDFPSTGPSRPKAFLIEVLKGQILQWWLNRPMVRSWSPVQVLKVKFNRIFPRWTFPLQELLLTKNKKTYPFFLNLEQIKTIPLVFLKVSDWDLRDFSDLRLNHKSTQEPKEPSIW